MHILSAHTINRENSSNRPVALLSGPQTDLFGQRKILFGFPSEKQALKRGDGSTGVQGWTIKITTGKICVSVRPLNLSVVNWKITEPLSGATIKPFFPRCIDKVSMEEVTEYDTVIQCDHSYNRRCAKSLKTTYEAQQVRENVFDVSSLTSH